MGVTDGRLRRSLLPPARASDRRNELVASLIPSACGPGSRQRPAYRSDGPMVRPRDVCFCANGNRVSEVVRWPSQRELAITPILNIPTPQTCQPGIGWIRSGHSCLRVTTPATALSRIARGMRIRPRLNRVRVADTTVPTLDRKLSPAAVLKRAASAIDCFVLGAMSGADALRAGSSYFPATSTVRLNNASIRLGQRDSPTRLVAYRACARTWRSYLNIGVP